MAHSEQIGKELEELSKAVAGLPDSHPFTVPSGYFQQFPEKMLELIRHSEETLEERLPLSLSGLSHKPTGQVPQGYFDRLPEKMLELVLRAEEASSAVLPAILTGLKDKETFRVPSGYFDSLPERMLQVLAASEEGRPETAEEELQRLSPLLMSISREYPGKVPAGYFDNFQAERTERAQAPVVSFNRKGQSIRPLLAAAVTLGAILLSAVWGYHIYVQPTGIRSGINLKTADQFNSALAKISDQTILDYLKDNTDVSDADLLASEPDEQQPNSNPGSQQKSQQ
jgi:hypothetical protein